MSINFIHGSGNVIITFAYIGDRKLMISLMSLIVAFSKQTG